MHVVCLGVLLIALGNSLVPLFKALKGTKRNWRKACGRLHNMMAIAARDLGVDTPIRFLTLSMIWPAAKQPCMRVKAKEARDLLPAVHHMLLNFFQPLE